MSWRPLVFGYTPLDPTNRKQTLKSKYNLGSDSGRGVSPRRQESNQSTFRSSKELSEVDFSTISQVLARNLPLKISQKKDQEFHQQSDSAEVSPRSPVPLQNSGSVVHPLSFRSLNPTPSPVSGRRIKRHPRGNSLIKQKRSVLTKLNKKEKETIRPIPLDSPVQRAIHLRSYANVSESDTVLPNSSSETDSEAEAEDLEVPIIYVKEPTHQQIDIEGRFISMPEYEESFNTDGFSTVNTDSRYILEDIPDLESDRAYHKYNELKRVSVHVKKKFKESRNRLKKLAIKISDDSEEETSSEVPKVKNRLPREQLDVPYDQDRYVDTKTGDTNVKLPRRRLKKQAVHSERKQLRSEPSGTERDHLIKRLEEKNVLKNRSRLIPTGFDSQSEQDKDHIQTEIKTLKSRLNDVHEKHQRLIPVGYDTKLDFDNRLDGHRGHRKSKPLDYYSDIERKPRHHQQKKPTRHIIPTKPRRHVRTTDIVQDTSDQESIVLSRPPRYPIRRSQKPLEDARHQPIPHKLFDEYGREYIVRHSRPHTFAPSDLNDHLTTTHKPPATHNRAGITHANDLLPAHPIPSAPVGQELKSSSHAVPVSSYKYVFYDGGNKIYVPEDDLHNSKGLKQKFANASAKVNFERRLKDHIHDQHRDASYDLRHIEDSNSLHFKMDDYSNHTEISPYALEKLSAKKFFKDMGRLPDERRMDHGHRKDLPSKDYNLRGQRGMPPVPLPRGYSDETRGHPATTPDSMSRGFSRGTYSGNVPLDQSANIQGDTSVDPRKNQIHIYSYGPLNINSGTPVPKGDVNESVSENPNEKGTSTDDINKKSGMGHFLAQGQGRDGFRYVNEDLNSSGYGTEGPPQNNERMRTDLSWRKKNSAGSTKKNVYVVKTPLHDKDASVRPLTQRSTSKQVQTVNSSTKEIQTKPETVVADSETQKFEPGSLDDIKQKVREIWHELGAVAPTEEEDKEEALIEDMYFDHDEDAQYIMCLVTDDGDIIGPFSMEIDDVQIGFGKMLLERHPELMTVPSEEEEEKQDGEKTEKQGEVEKESKQQPQTEQEAQDKEGLRNRISSPNDMNEFSSRSHTMLQLMVDNEIPDPDDENLYITKHGKLTFVDLAGSEKVKDSTVISDEFMAETNNINKSLLVLGNCISALADSKKRLGHIPYRDSKLTKLLADSIGGSGVTLMIACVSPSSQNTAETMNTLRYANRAKKIKNKPIVKMDPREKLILTLKRELKILRQENHYLRQQLNFPEKPRGKLQRENDEQFLKLMKQNARKINKDRDKDFKSDEDFDQIPLVLASTILPPAKVMPITNSAVQTPNTSDGPLDSGKPPSNPDGSGLYEMLQEYMVENETLRSENNDLQGFKEKTRRDQQNLSHENERLQRRLEEIERLLSSERPNRFANNIDTQYPYSDPKRQGSYGDLPPVDYRSGPNGYQGNSPPGSNNQSRQRQRSVTLPQHLPMKPPHRLNEPVTPRGNTSYPGQNSSEKVQQRLDQRDPQGGYGHNGSPTQIRGPPSGAPSGYYGGYDQNGPRQSNSRTNSGVYDDQDPVPTPRRKPGPTPDPIPRKSTTSQQVNPQSGTGTHH